MKTGFGPLQHRKMRSDNLAPPKILWHIRATVAAWLDILSCLYPPTLNMQSNRSPSRWLTLISPTCMMRTCASARVCACVYVCVRVMRGLYQPLGSSLWWNIQKELPEECIQHQAVKWSSGKAISSTHGDLLLSLPLKLWSKGCILLK